MSGLTVSEWGLVVSALRVASMAWHADAQTAAQINDMAKMDSLVALARHARALADVIDGSAAQI